MVRNKKHVRRDSQQSPMSSGLGSFIDPDEPEILLPETAEDFLLLALEKSGLIGIVRLLRDLHGRKAIKSIVDNLEHRGPTDQYTSIRRHAVELYAIKHNLTPANLMVSLIGKNERADAEGAERHKLKAARQYVEQNENALFGARALAKHWDDNRPNGRNIISHLKKINPKV
jgi:hypothetical protein